jgi:hypothetical protein
MNIALCISGMMRTFEKCIPTIIENIINANKEHQFSSFIATWDVCGRNPVWWEISKDNTPVDFNKILQYKKDLNLKKLSIDTFEESDFMKKVHEDVSPGGKYSSMKGEHCNPYNCLPMFKKIEQAHLLMIDNKVHYDIVVKMRADLFFKSKLEIIKPEPKTIYMPKHECWGPGSLNDQFLYGDGHTMSYHSSLYKKLDELYSVNPTLHPESVLHQHYSNAQIQIVKYPIDYHIER